MGRIEVITHTERRRKYSPAERHAIMLEADAPVSPYERWRSGTILPRA